MAAATCTASVICVPMLASWTIGTVISAVSVRYITKSPIEISSSTRRSSNRSSTPSYLPHSSVSAFCAENSITLR
jgi:hypothetical protein